MAKETTIQLRVTEAEKARWVAAAGEFTLSEWIRGRVAAEMAEGGGREEEMRRLREDNERLRRRVAELQGRERAARQAIRSPEPRMRAGVEEPLCGPHCAKLHAHRR